MYNCDYCNQSFTQKPNKYRHQNYRCSDNPDLKCKPVKQSTENVDLLSIIQKKSTQIKKIIKELVTLRRLAEVIVTCGTAGADLATKHSVRHQGVTIAPLG